MNFTEHVPQTAWDEPRLMKNMVISQKAPFMKTLRYIFLTEWQLCAKRVDPGSHRVPRAPSNWQLIAHMDPSVPNIEAKLLEFWLSYCPWTKGFVTFHDRSKIAVFHTGPTQASVINCQTLVDSSQLQQPWFLEARQRKHWWLGETELVLTRGSVQCRSCVNWWQGQKMKSIRVSSENRGARLSTR